MNQLGIKKRAQILHMLVEGNSLRATARMADVSRNTVDKLLRDVGAACLAYQDEYLRNLPCKRVQCDEIWSFVYSKQKNVPEGMEDDAGDIWTWVSICSDTKIVPCWHVDNRGAAAAKSFMDDLAGRLANRVQLTTDGHKVYVDAVEGAFGADIDYAMLVKIYGGDKGQEKRYSPASYEGAKKTRITGSPDKAHISTSHVERQNLTMRMSMRRFTRLTNAFSKKIDNHMHAISLHYMYYNFGRIHQTLRVTPAMEAGVSDHVWTLEEIAGLVPDEEPKKRGPYKKNNIPFISTIY
ncbi:MAG: helix-turn-helix domain-containing protein [Gammaproteobacteria bacterium]|nr:helix-turn-helix domain-containing protein [Gammaproteobacteria bacterium]